MNGIMELIGVPLGYIMYFVYSIIPYYGVALFLYTLITRAALFPISLKQHKNSIKSMALQPELKAIQEKYKGDAAKIQEEQGKVYAREGQSQTAGCFPMVIQMLLLFGVIDVIYRPITHILHLGADVIANATNLLGMLGISSANPSMIQLEIINQVQTKPGFFSSLGAEAVDHISSLSYNFLGMDLMIRPTWSMINIFDKASFNWVILIPIISGITSLLMSLINNKYSPAAAGVDAAAAKSTRNMMLMMPIFSLFMTFSVPAGVGLYWIFSNVVACLQTILLNKFYNPKEIQQEIEDSKKAREAEEKKEREEAKKRVKSGEFSADDAEKALSQKEADRIRLAEGRKRDALKYGEVYNEEDDD